MAASVSQRKVFCTGMGLDGGERTAREAGPAMAGLVILARRGIADGTRGVPAAKRLQHVWRSIGEESCRGSRCGFGSDEACYAVIGSWAGSCVPR